MDILARLDHQGTQAKKAVLEVLVRPDQKDLLALLVLLAHLVTLVKTVLQAIQENQDQKAMQVTMDLPALPEKTDILVHLVKFLVL